MSAEQTSTKSGTSAKARRNYFISVFTTANQKPRQHNAKERKPTRPTRHRERSDKPGPSFE